MEPRFRTVVRGRSRSLTSSWRNRQIDEDFSTKTSKANIFWNDFILFLPLPRTTSVSVHTVLAHSAICFQLTVCERDLLSSRKTESGLISLSSCPLGRN